VSGIQRIAGAHGVPLRRFAVGDLGVGILLPVAEMATIVALAVAVGTAYHLIGHASFGATGDFALIGSLVGVLYTLPFLFRDEYRIDAVLSGQRSPWRAFVVWSYAFLALGIVGFLTKTTAVYSRGWLLVFYALGLVGLLALGTFTTRLLQRARAAGRLRRRRVALVGWGSELKDLRERLEGNSPDITVVDTVDLAALGPSPNASGGPVERDASAAGLEISDSAIRGMLERARELALDDVVVAAPWSAASQIRRVADALSELPVAIHLGTAAVLDRFTEPRVGRIGRANTLALVAPPLTPVQQLLKRAFDIVVAGTALLILAPFLALVALLVRLDSPGPALFLQRRRGFNREEFSIYKFRSMTTQDNGDHVQQATKNDPRVTRIGRVLRRWSIDELPQLLNVLEGTMSIVGPRPHAVAHDRLYEPRIRLYPRRLNVKPGITGWAQVHGLRGETDTDEKMSRRVEHDLYYVDNWSMGLDLYICLLTFVSPSTWRNVH
jgi:Undecaprenyl-phosphate glucose phosphotransferase